MSRSRQPRRKPDVQQLLGRLAAEEEQFLRQEFLAPALQGSGVRVRIAGVVCDVCVIPPDFTGWGVFQPESHAGARLVRPATLAERRHYLDLFPLVRLVVCRQSAADCLCCPASFGDRRFQIEGLAPVDLAEAVQSFDVIGSRYDGSRFWFDGLDPRHNPATAAYLRAALAKLTRPDELDRPGLTAEERAAYELNYLQLVRPAIASAPPEDAVRQRLRENLSHAGAQLIDYLERGDGFRVTYSIDGQSYTSAVNKSDLTVQVAGICLSGEDQKFDLASLVGVLREAGDEGHIVPVGGPQGMNEEHYWHAHPPRNR
jgi:hypothetical protein